VHVGIYKQLRSTYNCLVYGRNATPIDIQLGTCYRTHTMPTRTTKLDLLDEHEQGMEEKEKEKERKKR